MLMIQIFAHEGHEHTEEAVKAVTSHTDELNYGGYLLLTLGLIILFVGIVFLTSAFTKRSNKSKAIKDSTKH